MNNLKETHESIKKADPISPLIVNVDDISKVINFGLSKREYFAAKAMQGFCATGGYATSGDIAEDSVKAADALLEELAK